MSGPARFPEGISTAPNRAYHPLGNFPLPNPAYIHNYFNDFDQYVAADWTVGAVGAGTAALASGNGGLILQSVTGASGDSVHNLKNPAAFTITPGYQAWFMYAGQIDTVASSTLQIGMQAGGTAFAPVDGIFFTKAAAATTLVANVRKAGVVTTLTLGTNLVLTDATKFVCGWYYDGRSINPTISFYAGLASKWVTDAAQSSRRFPYWQSIVQITDMTNLPIVALAPGFGAQTNAVATRAFTTDYILAAADMVR